MKKDIKELIEFIHYAEGLKLELRHASRSDSERESAAEHAWRMALMLMISYPDLKTKINLLHTIKMILVHDLVEIDAQDVPLINR